MSHFSKSISSEYIKVRDRQVASFETSLSLEKKKKLDIVLFLSSQVWNIIIPLSQMYSNQPTNQRTKSNNKKKNEQHEFDLETKW